MTDERLPQPAMSGADWAALLTLSLLWAGSFLFYRILAFELPPTTTAFGRVVIAGVALFAVLRARGVRIAVPAPMRTRFLVLGLLNCAVPFSLFAWAESRVASGTAAILNAMVPVFTILVSALVLRTERLTRARVVGIAFGFLGVAVLVGPAALVGQDVLGQLACLLAAVVYGFALPYGRRITGLPPTVVALGQMVASSLLLLPVVLVIDQPWGLPAMDVRGWAALAGLGLLSTALAYIIFFGILARAGATNLSLVTLLIPVTSLILGSLLLDEPVTARAVGGIALIGVGLAAIDGRIVRRFRRRAREPVTPSLNR